MESQDSQFELHDHSAETTAHGEVAILSLPPADGGYAAWLFLTGSFTIELLLWGFPFSFGVLQDYYSTHPPFASQPGISAVGTTCSGIMYLSASLLFALFQRYPKFCRQATFYGLPVVAAAVALSSFATKVWHLVLTQGVLYAIGGGLLYYPVFIFIDEWFVRRKSFAYGVMWAGSGCGGLSGPLVLNWGLGRYGVETFMRGWAIALFVLIAPLLYFVRPRVPLSRARANRSVSLTAGFAFVKTRTFWVLQIGNVIQGLGYFIPALYLPNYARSLNISPLRSSVIVSTLNIASVPGVVLLSALCDRIAVTTVILISAAGSALSVFFVWGFSSPASSTSLPLLILFAILYGFFAGGFTATYSGIVKELRRVSPAGGADLGSMFGLLSVGRGIGNVVCGPISELLIRRMGDGGGVVEGTLAYGSRYGPLIVFTGTTMVVALTPWVGRRLRLI